MPSASTKPVHRIASIPGDGIGPEVISAGITVLKKLALVLGTFDLEFDHFDWSSDYYRKHGRYIPEGGLEELKKYNAILFGAVGAPGLGPSFLISTSRLTLHPQRRPRPHIPLVPTPRPRPTPPTLRHRPPHPRPPWHHFSTLLHRIISLLPQLGNNPRKHRRRIRRPRRPHAHRTTMGSSHRNSDLHPSWHRAGNEIRVRGCKREKEEEAVCGDEE